MDVATSEWQRTFLQKLEKGKQKWRKWLDEFLIERVDPVFADMEAFAAKNGIEVSAPKCDPSVRLFKFGLTENGYVIFWFGQRGIDRAEARYEMFLPGVAQPQQDNNHVQLVDADKKWVLFQFQQGLDQLVTAFAELGPVPSEEELVEA